MSDLYRQRGRALTVIARRLGCEFDEANHRGGMGQQVIARPRARSSDDGAGPTPRAWGAPAWLLLALVGLLLGLFRAEAPLGDSDVLWGARAGINMLDSGHVPHVDYYSWTAPGRMWIPNSWGWNLILGVTYKTGGLTAIFFLGIALTVFLCLVIGWFARRVGADPARTIMIVAVTGMLMRFPLYARPQFIDYVMVFAFPALVPIALRGDSRSGGRAAAALCALQVLWMNLHTSAVLGPAIVAAAGAGVLFAGSSASSRRTMALRLAALIAAAAACCLATPYGAAPITHIQEVRDASVGYIKEWQPAGFSGSGPIFAVVAIGLALAAAGLAARSRRYDSAGVLLLMAAATASAIRFMPMAVLFAVPEFAVLLGHVKVRHVFADRVAALGCVTIGLLVLAKLPDFAEPGNDSWAPRLVAEVPQHCRILNDYGIGGELLLTRPDVRVAWDGRNDLYGKAIELRVDGYLHAAPGTLHALDRARVNCVLTNSTDPIVGKLEQGKRWRTVGTEGSRTLLVRAGTD